MRYSFVIALLVAFTGCQPADPAELGRFTVEIQVYHHAEPVSGLDIYLMEYAEDFPGENLEDYHFQTRSDSNGIATFTGILSGYHWINGYGFDGQDTIKGNRQIYLDPQDSDDFAKFILHVTEKH